jgi:hypothetical protein
MGKITNGYQPEKKLIGEVIPPNTGSNVRMPKRVEPAQDNIRPWEMAQASVMRGLMDDPYGDAIPTQRKIREITNAMQDLLLYKNQKYGDSAINPLCIFTKHIKSVDTKTAAILVRIDDKISRVKNADELRTNDVADILGYCTLLLISMGVTPEDIAKFKD